ncbi:hypothetical protein ATO6_13865 [Oceanicola sp. 22II-s10i]|uniref:C4-dicarboxylate TRAP transporter substrate-binding protein n=1 Tax=Oceanicola sp. 22II-s10i TaxID=1317116 RepID=UPI000B69674C|nr:C4-dicarboxylate TRAP transporter substrate-binding protein [Oceanicola sp. 22II-s10i]OWU84144.1 hypothetical protein ATO6_13865 [Oceanicola sp. 22II-s10i]
MKFTSLPVAAVTAVTLGLAGTQAGAVDLTFGTYVGPTTTTFREGTEPLLKRLEEQSGGDMKWEAFTGGAMGGPKELLGNAGSGVLDASGVVDIYVKASVPHSAMVSGMLIVGEDPKVMAAAMNEWQLLNCPECLEDHEKNNVIAMGFTATGTYHLICKDEVHTAEQLKGKKVRAVGGMGRAIQELGGTAVSITTAEMYEAMQRGQMDCATGSIAWLDTYALKDFSKSVVLDSMGSYFGIMGFVMNKQVWEELSDSNKQIIKDNMARLVADIVFAYGPEGDEALKNFEASGGKAYEFDDELKEGVARIRAAEYETTAKINKDAGMENAEELVNAYKTLVDKWTKIVAEVGDDKEAYIQALQTEVYDKL